MFGVGGRREVSRQCCLIMSRVWRRFSLTFREIKRTEYADMLGGHSTHRGASMMEDTGAAEKVFMMPVKLGVPSGFGGLTEAAVPIHATGVGLCMYGLSR